MVAREAPIGSSSDVDPKLKPRLSNLAPCLKDLIGVRFTTIGCSLDA